MFGKRIDKNYPFINLFVSVNTQQKRNLIKISSEEQLKTVFEIILNILSGYIEISPLEKKLIKKYKRTIVYLLDKSNSPQKKRLKLIKNIALIEFFLKIFKRFSERNNNGEGDDID